jgi:hypothetical protein
LWALVKTFWGLPGSGGPGPGVNGGRSFRRLCTAGPTRRLMMTSSSFRAAADAVVALHFGFVLFVVFGGLIALRWRWVAWLHLPAAVWGIAIEYGGWECPLTPLENYLRERGSLAAYRGDFIERYMLSLLYPARLTRSDQILLGSLALGLNGFIYGRMIRTARRLPRLREP